VQVPLAQPAQVQVQAQVPARPAQLAPEQAQVPLAQPAQVPVRSAQPAQVQARSAPVRVLVWWWMALASSCRGSSVSLLSNLAYKVSTVSHAI
jgi:hypothetical protein